jgi:hypothetical protein
MDCPLPPCAVHCPPHHLPPHRLILTMRIPTLLALSAASVAALPASNKLHKKQASPNAPNAFGLAFTTPPPMADGGAWSAAFERASGVASQLTLEEKVSPPAQRAAGSIPDIASSACHRFRSSQVKLVDVSVTPERSLDWTSLRFAFKMARQVSLLLPLVIGYTLTFATSRPATG